MNLDDVQEILEEGELSPYQAKAFVAILELRDASVSEIVESCTVPQPRIYDVLRTLDEKGFIETYEKDTLRARVYNPTSLVSELESKSNRYTDAAQKIEDVWEQPPVVEHNIEIFNDFDTFISHAMDGIEGAEGSVNVASSASEYLSLRPNLRSAKKSDVIVNLSIYLRDTAQTKISNLEKDFEKTTSEVRHRRNYAPFLTLVDASKSFFGIPHRRNGYGLFVQDPALSTMLYSYFQDSLWSRWDRIYLDRPGAYPKEYGSLRNCVSEIRSPAQNGETLYAAVNGYETASGREKQVSGQIIDVVPESDDEVSIEKANQVSLTIDTGSATYTIGGFGAILEDIRATTIRIERDN